MQSKASSSLNVLGDTYSFDGYQRHSLNKITIQQGALLAGMLNKSRIAAYLIQQWIGYHSNERIVNESILVISAQFAQIIVGSIK